MSSVGGPRRSPGTVIVSVRMTAEERTVLERAAGRRAVSTFLRDTALASVGTAPRPRAPAGHSASHGPTAAGYRRRKTSRKVEPNARLLAEVLACLGRTGIGRNIAALAASADRGALQFDPDAPRLLARALEDVTSMRLLLLAALGHHVPVGDVESHNHSLTIQFTRAATCSFAVGRSL